MTSSIMSIASMIKHFPAYWYIMHKGQQCPPFKVVKRYFEVFLTLNRMQLQFWTRSKAWPEISDFFWPLSLWIVSFNVLFWSVIVIFHISVYWNPGIEMKYVWELWDWKAAFDINFYYSGTGFSIGVTLLNTQLQFL